MDAVAQLNTSLAGRYDVEREIGAGGMATVYLARDVKHQRRVALKVLRPDLGAVLGLERFLAEIQVTANLQHPNLLPLFDSGEADGHLFYVMPYVEGESLRARLTREKQLPIDDAVRIATAVAAALDYAHRNGVIHRDLKPENILLQDGQPVIADFGIALAVSKAGGGRITQTGLSLGTPQYMSPEQATGDRTIDGRTDIYSLAAVTYEMLSGEPPHIGHTSQAVIARVLTEVPRSIRITRPSVPEHVDDALLCGLEKLPADRFATAGEFAAALTGARAARQPTAAATAARRRATAISWRSPALLAGVGLGAAAVAATWMVSSSRRAIDPPPPVTRSRVIVPGRFSGTVGPVSISPDGKTIALAATADSGGAFSRIYVRRSDELELRPLAGTERGRDPVFSPDGAWIAFRVPGDSLFKVPVNGGTRMKIVSNLGHSYSWTHDGRLLYAAAFREGRRGAIFAVPEAGGSPELICECDSLMARWPTLLPDGKGILFTGGMPEAPVVRVLELPSKVVRTLITPGNRPLYVPTGHIVYSLPGSPSLMAVPFDLDRRTLTGNPVPIAQVANGLSISKNGTAVYITDASADAKLFTVRPNEPPQALPIEGGEVRSVRLSPEGRRVAYGVGQRTYMHDLSLGTRFPLLPDKNSWDPIWTLDGKSVAVHTIATGEAGFMGVSVAADGSGQPRQLFRQPGVLTAVQAFFPNGRALVRGPRPGLPASGSDLHVVTFVNDSVRVSPYLRADWDESHAVASPDGRFTAFASSETGRQEIYVRPFPDPSGGKWRISERGAIDAVWSRDGGTIYYWEGAELRAARVRTQPDFAILGRNTVLTDPFYSPSCCYPNFDVFPDGKTFIMARREGASEQSSFVMVTNWFEELKTRR